MKFFEDILPWFAEHDTSFFQIIIGLVIALVGPFITFYIGRSADLHCVRTGADQIRCDITKKLLGFQPLGTSRVYGIQKAEVDENIDSQGDSTYRVVFVTPYERVALTSFTSSGYAPKADLANQVNDFINNDQPSILEVQQKIDGWIWVFFFGFTGLGVGMILVSLKKFMS
jgi:hypothetical protein